MPERGQHWLFEVERNDSAFLRSMGIEDSIIDPCPEPLLLPYPEGSRLRLAEKDVLWLKAGGVAWDPEPECQLPLGFCDRPKAAQ